MRPLIAFLLVLGCGLLFVSSPPLFAMGYELFEGKRVSRTYDMERLYVNNDVGAVKVLSDGPPIPVEGITLQNHVQVGNETTFIPAMAAYNEINQKNAGERLSYVRTYVWSGHTIQLVDQFRASDNLDTGSRNTSNLTIIIDGSDWSVDSPASVRPFFLDENRYHGYFGIVKVKEGRGEMLALVQRTSGLQVTLEERLTWRILLVDRDGQVQEERFRYEEREEVPYRVSLVNLSNASPVSLGYHSGILMGWPNLFFPLLYPFVSGLLGSAAILTGAALMALRRQRARRIV